MNKELLKQLREEKKTYREMVEFCCDNLILNNDIMQELSKKDIYFELYSGCDYIEEYDEYCDIYQFYIISELDAERLAEFTNEIVYYNEELNLYILGVTHYGTSWGYVPSGWKEEEQENA